MWTVAAAATLIKNELKMQAKDPGGLSTLDEIADHP